MSSPGVLLFGMLALAALGASFTACGGSPRRPTNGAARTCAPGKPGFVRVKPLLDRYCITCHSADGVAGDEHDFLQPELLRAQHRQISARLRAHSMPPRGSPQPERAELALIAHWADCGGTQ
jgi:uncharacterized membrane protein